jgi:hypothetical protein
MALPEEVALLPTVEPAIEGEPAADGVVTLTSIGRIETNSAA